MENKKTGALAYLFCAALSLIMLLAVIKFMGVPLTWFAVFCANIRIFSDCVISSTGWFNRRSYYFN